VRSCMCWVSSFSLHSFALVGGSAVTLTIVLATLAAPNRSMADSSGRDITIAAAVSLRTAVDEFSAGFRRRHPSTPLSTTYGASNALAAQIRFGAPIDIFLSADPEIIDDLEGRTLISPGSRVAFASNRLVVVSSPEQSIGIREARDLLHADFRKIALPGAGVPLGRYARLWLARHDLEAEIARRVVITADLAIVYASDLGDTSRARIAHRIPEDEQPPIAYEAVRVSRAGVKPSGRDAIALYLEELVGAPGSSAIRRAGLIPIDRSARAESNEHELLNR